MNLKQFQLLLGIFLLGVSLSAMFYNSREPALSAQDFIERCDTKYGYASWHVEVVPTRQDTYTYICVPQNSTNTTYGTDFTLNWSAVKG